MYIKGKKPDPIPYLPVRLEDWSHHHCKLSFARRHEFFKCNSERQNDCTNVDIFQNVG